MVVEKNHADEVVFLYGTCGSDDEARRIAQALLEERLVACVNVLPGMRSFYRWEGTVQEDNEVVFIAKTARTLWDQVASRFVALHSYDEPALLALPVSDGLPGYLQWVLNETKSD